MKISNIEIKSCAVEIKVLHPFEVQFCDDCSDEPGQYELHIKRYGAEGGHMEIHLAVGDFCAEKYLRAFAS